MRSTQTTSIRNSVKSTNRTPGSSPALVKRVRFYTLQGWETKTGYPTATTMKSLGLDYVAAELLLDVEMADCARTLKLKAPEQAVALGLGQCWRIRALDGWLKRFLQNAQIVIPHFVLIEARNDNAYAKIGGRKLPLICTELTDLNTFGIAAKIFRGFL